jgi:hypothetical protein
MILDAPPHTGWRLDVQRIFDSATVVALSAAELPRLAEAIAHALVVPVQQVTPSVMRSVMTRAIAIERDRSQYRDEAEASAALAGASAFLHLDGGPTSAVAAALRTANPAADPERNPKAFRWSYARYAEMEALTRSAPARGFGAKTGKRSQENYRSAVERAMEAAFASPSLLSDLRTDVRVYEPLPRQVGSLLSRGEELADDLRVSRDAYVTRTLEQTVFDDLTSSQHSWPWAIVGEAGHGKSTLLVRIFDRIRDESALTPILISAAWFLEKGPGRLTLSKTVAMLRAVIERSEQPVLLVDTADLLLHDSASLHLVRSLILEAEELGVTVGLTTRPREAELLRSSDLRRRHLSVYDDTELIDAVTNLVALHLPRDDHAQTLHDVLAATARGLPVAEICRSPLLLRLLFELADGRPPVLQEVDVTRLYEDLWQRRIVRDIRSDDDLALARHPTDDLSLVTGAIGLAFLAAGTPELDSATLTSLTRRVIDAAAFPVPELSTAIDTLLRRGVLTYSADRVRFFHQTVFEFAAAKSLAHRPGPPAVRALLRRVVEERGDLFVGAVLEQLMLILAPDPTATAELRSGVEALLARSEALQDIGLLVWTRQPRIIDRNSPTLRAAAPTAVARAARSVPAIATLPPERASQVLEVLWEIGEAESHIAVLEAYARLARRAPAEVSASIARAGVIDDAIRHEALTSDETRVLADLAIQIAPVAYAESQQIIKTLVTREARVPRATGALIELLEVAAHHWQALGGNRALLEDLLPPLVVLPHDQETVLALAALFTSEWRRVSSETPDLRPLLARVLNPDDEEPLSLAIAKLVAIGKLFSEIEPADEVGELLDMFWNADDEQLRPFVDGTVFPQLLASQSAAGAVLASRLKHHLAQVEDSPTAPSTERAIRVLGFAAVPAGVLRDAVPAHWPERVWLEHERLLTLLPPAAAAGNGPAQRVIRDMKARIPELGEASRIALRAAAINFAAAYPPMIPVILALDSTFHNAFGIRRVAKSQALRRELIPLLPDMLDLAEELLLAPATEDDAADLVRLITSYSDNLIDWPRLRRYLARASTSRVSGDLIRSIWRLDLTVEQVEDVVRYLASFVEIRADELPATRTRVNAPDRDERVIEQVRVAWLRILTLEAAPAPENWPTIRALALSTVDSSTTSLDGQDLAVVADYLANVARADAAKAQTMFIDLLQGMVGAEFAGWETLLWRRELHNAMRPHVIQAELAGLDRIIEATAGQSVEIAEQMLDLIAETRYPDARPALIGLLDRSLPSDLRQVVVRILRERDRAHGTSAFTEVLDIIRPVYGRPDS